MSVQKKSLKSSATKSAQKGPATAKEAPRKVPAAAKSVSLKKLFPSSPC